MSIPVKVQSAGIICGHGVSEPLVDINVHRLLTTVARILGNLCINTYRERNS